MHDATEAVCVVVNVFPSKLSIWVLQSDRRSDAIYLPKKGLLVPTLDRRSIIVSKAFGYLPRRWCLNFLLRSSYLWQTQQLANGIFPFFLNARKAPSR